MKKLDGVVITKRLIPAEQLKNGSVLQVGKRRWVRIIFDEHTPGKTT